jgi:hypothetical protein
LATVGYLWQVMCVYIFSGYAKTGKDWKEGWAVTATLNLETYRLDNMLVSWLLSMPLLCYYTTFATVYGAARFMLLLPSNSRTSTYSLHHDHCYRGLLA